MHYWHDRSDVRPRLLVNDAGFIRNWLYSLFENDGYQVFAACNAKDGLAIYRDSLYPIDLLVADDNMPDVSGLDLVCECTRLNPELSVLYLRGSERDEEIQDDLQKGRRNFLVKPFHEGDLLRKARELLLTSPSVLAQAKRGREVLFGTRPRA